MDVHIAMIMAMLQLLAVLGGSTQIWKAYQVGVHLDTAVAVAEFDLAREGGLTESTEDLIKQVLADRGLSTDPVRLEITGTEAGSTDYGGDVTLTLTYTHEVNLLYGDLSTRLFTIPITRSITTRSAVVPRGPQP